MEKKRTCRLQDAQSGAGENGTLDSRDVLHLVFQFGGLDRVEFRPCRFTTIKLSGSHVYQRVLVGEVSKVWRDARMTLSTELLSEPPNNWGGDTDALSPKLPGETGLKFRQFYENLLVCPSLHFTKISVTSLGHHAASSPFPPPPSGRSCVDVARLLRMPSLEELRVEASELHHSGASLVSLAETIAASSSLKRIEITSKTRDNKPKVVLTSPHHKERDLATLADAVVEFACESFGATFQNIYKDRVDGPQLLVISRHGAPLEETLRHLVANTCAGGTIQLGAGMTLALLFSEAFAAKVEAERRKAGLKLGFALNTRMTDSVLRRLKKFKPGDVLDAVKFSGDEFKAMQVLDAPAWRGAHLRELKGVCVPKNEALGGSACARLASSATPGAGPLFPALTSLHLHGMPSMSALSLTLQELDLHFTGAAKYENPSWEFNFEHHTNLRTLKMQAAGASWLVTQLPPNVLEVDFNYIAITPDAYNRVARLDKLRLTNCMLVVYTPDWRSRLRAHNSLLQKEKADLLAWIIQTGPIVFETDHWDRNNTDWKVPFPMRLAEFATALDSSRMRRLAIVGLGGHFNFTISAPHASVSSTQQLISKSDSDELMDAVLALPGSRWVDASEWIEGYFRKRAIERA
mmetsp:Transcript_48750/g.98084  ORF Transcript_48750/g.98084 Transcript_48750/m.98084 type:complete len:634 (+) Transcript_48750:73-1974(+)